MEKFCLISRLRIFHRILLESKAAEKIFDVNIVVPKMAVAPGCSVSLFKPLCGIGGPRVVTRLPGSNVHSRIKQETPRLILDRNLYSKRG
jgi:hypothetical protein